MVEKARSHRLLFDPESLPVDPPHVTLPPVPVERLTPDALRQRFMQYLTRGWMLEGEGDFPAASRDKGVDPRLAAVLVPLVDRPAGMTVLLTQRAAHLTDHAGQISFPGGRCDPGDLDTTDTALREAWEEIRLGRDCVEPLGTLPDYLTGTGYAVSPVVALVHPPFDLIPSEREVAEIFEIPLAFLMNPANHQTRLFDSVGEKRRFFSMPYPRADGAGDHFVWGATAGMLRNLYRFLIA